MFKILLYLICLFTISISIHANPKSFYMKNGDTITGDVLSYDKQTGIYKVRSNFGVIEINKQDIANQKLHIILKNGDSITGILIERNDTHYSLQTSYGELTLLISDIDRVEIVEEDTNASSKSSTWVFSNEELMDLYSDPTGFTMKKNTLYVSGLSWGYSVTDTLQLTTRYWDSITSGELNLRSKWMIFKGGSLEHKKAISIGSHIYSGGTPNKYIYQDVSDEDDSFDDEASLWGSIFMAYTASSIKPNNLGRFSKTIGTEITFYRHDPIMLRTYAGISYDLRKDLKLLSILFYDPYLEDNQTTLYFDLGFIYAYNEHLRVGIHFQRPFLSLYYKF